MQALTPLSIIRGSPLLESLHRMEHLHEEQVRLNMESVLLKVCPLILWNDYIMRGETYIDLYIFKFPHPSFSYCSLSLSQRLQFFSSLRGAFDHLLSRKLLIDHHLFSSLDKLTFRHDPSACSFSTVLPLYSSYKCLLHG